jgi:conserved oligomeric Golgi complex subunit 6
MDTTYTSSLNGFNGDGSDKVATGVADGLASRKANAISNKLATVLSSSYADAEIRDSLKLLELRSTPGHTISGQDLRLSVEKEVIDVNGKVIDDFGDVAEVL